jgi:hypothetical protein
VPHSGEPEPGGRGALEATASTGNADHAQGQPGWPPQTDPQTPYPTLDEICETGAYYLPQDKGLVRRHVESVSFHDETVGKRRLTLDMVLPRDPAAAIAWAPDGYRFYVPLALMAKDPPTTNIDLLDEDERSLPLLNRAQNAQLTHAALARMAERVLDGELSHGLRRALEIVVSADGLEAELALEYAYLVMEDEHPGKLALPAARVFKEVLNDFSVNSLIWIGLTGRPGARRVVKFRYDIAVRFPPIPREHAYTRWVLVETSDAWHEFEYDFPGDGHPRSSFMRICNRLANTFGWAPIDLSIDSPYLRGCESYHMQVDAPPGLEIRNIRLAGELVDGAGEEVRYKTEISGPSAHLYFADARPEGFSFATVTLRASRRGFLSLSLVAAGITTLTLWAFQARAEEARADEGVAAAILLVVPALLALFVVRPGEHALATRVFSGVRLLVLGAALFSIAAAGALIGVRPSAWTLREAWYHYAVGASVLAGLLSVSWVLALQGTWRAGSRLHQLWRSRGLYFASSLVVTIGEAAVLGVGGHEPEWVRGLKGLFAVGLGCLVWAALLIATNNRRVEQGGAPGIAAFLGFGGAVTVAGASSLVFAVPAGWPNAWDWLALTLVVVIAAMTFAELIYHVRQGLRRRAA